MAQAHPNAPSYYSPLTEEGDITVGYMAPTFNDAEPPCSASHYTAARHGLAPTTKEYQKPFYCNKRWKGFVPPNRGLSYQNLTAPPAKPRGGYMSVPYGGLPAIPEPYNPAIGAIGTTA
eukprot:NODE_611_length_1267_cov_508.409688_g439_i0.p2 GENE.NODE_611_length_1267_cov_508.409688_g439_i0~~NODE_611_length_1267_cov_508.409688_g439_i0.p2  ORF type:complete len:119 (-),score=35.02 NODE_611_length_1267_cov_508.409688_g439_i0:538-894(-)